MGGFPGGGGTPGSVALDSVTIANPIAGAEVSWTPNFNLQLVAMQMILTTSGATAGVRTPFLLLTIPGESATIVSSTPVGQPPASAVQYQFLGSGDTTGPMAEATSVTFSNPLIIPAGATLSTYTVGGLGVGIGLAAADQYSLISASFVVI